MSSSNQLETSVNGHAVPRFSIFISPDSKETVDTLIHCFISRTTIDTLNPPANIRAADGWIYQAVYDSKLPASKGCPVIISFQKHSYGRFAIIRTVMDYETVRRFV